MNSRKKLVLTLSLVTVVFVILLTTFLVVFASMQQTISTKIRVTYKAVDIQGTVEATYTIGNRTEYLKKSGTDETKIAFTAGQDDQYASLEFPTENIELTSTNNYILLTYMFTNSGDAIYTAFMNIDTEGFSSMNMKMEYSLKEDGPWLTDQYALVVRKTEDTEKVKYFIRISIDNVAKNANFTGNFNWFLEKYETETDEENIALITNHYTKNEDGSLSAFYNGEDLTNGTLIIPSMVNGVPVTKIKESPISVDKTKVKTVVIPNSVATIDENAFSGYTNLRTVKFRDNSKLDTINSNVFAQCLSLQSIIIPSSVNKIKAKAFVGCSNLTSVIFELPNGWCAINESQPESSEIDLTLTDESVSATYLTSTYVNEVWNRTDD